MGQLGISCKKIWMIQFLSYIDILSIYIYLYIIYIIYTIRSQIECTSGISRYHTQQGTILEKKIEKSRKKTQMCTAKIA